MRIAVCGSIATDHLMTYQGRFVDSLVPDELAKISLSFLVDNLEIRRGGIAANVCFGMASLGQRPILVGAVGEDFAGYRSWLERHGVNCEHVHTSETRHTARFICTTDESMAQIATFYAGAMSEARVIELGPIADTEGGLDLVMVCPDDPEAMLRHTSECRTRGIPFGADPSQQLAFMDGDGIRRLIDGATYLITNDYEAKLTEQKTGWSAAEIADRVSTRIITQGADGVTVTQRGESPIHVPIAREAARVDPTGVGDAFRAGFLAGLTWGLDHERCAQVGSLLACHVIETVGTQEYSFSPEQFLDRLRRSYGAEAADAVAPHLIPAS